MNIYRFEARSLARATAIQAVVLAGLLALLMVAVYPVYLDGKDAVEQMLKGFPPEFAAAFGLNLKNFFSYGGFYAFSFNYVALVGAIYASSTGLKVFSREKRSECSGFLFVKPVSRTRIFAEKLLACLTSLALVNVVYVATAFLVHAHSGDATLTTTKVLLSALALLGSQLVILALSILVAVTLRRVRSVSGLASGIAFTAYLMEMLQQLTEDEAWRYLSPLQYFSPQALLTDGSFGASFVATAIGVIVVCLGAAYVHYRFADIAER